MHHLIFISGEHRSGLTIADQLAAVGLEDHAQGALSVPCVGPAGDGGTLYSWVPNKLHYNAAEQDWFPAVVDGDRPAGRYHVGVWQASPVCERDVRRPYGYGGKSVRLCNGEQWIIPTPQELPHTAKLADDGSWHFVIQRRFHDYYLRKMELVDRAAENPNFTYHEFLSVSIEALQLNYRLPPELISHLDLFDQLSVAEGFTAATGLDLEG